MPHPPLEFEQKNGLNLGEDQYLTPHRELASPHRDLVSTHRDLGVFPSRVERWMTRGKIASQD